MPRYFVKDPETGQSRIVYKAPSEVEPIKLSQPPTTTLPAAAPTKRFRCTVEGCGKLFATQGVASIHYNRSHRQSENKDEWRSFVEKVDAPNAPESH